MAKKLIRSTAFKSGSSGRGNLAPLSISPERTSTFKSGKVEGLMLSACLAGIKCVYDGTHKRHSVFAKMFKKGSVLLFCPEVLGGLKIPHPPSEIAGRDGFSVCEGNASVISKDGRNVTLYFIRGAKKTLELAKKNNIAQVIMKSRSPSCGCGWIYDGTFSKKLIPGYGVTAAMLKTHGIEVMSDEEYLEKIQMTKSKV